MLHATRLRYIVEKIERDDTVKIEDLTRELQVSAITVRRDLERLEQDGVVHRIHGGAMRKGFLDHEEKYDVKKTSNHNKKRAIAAECLPMIPENGTVIIDAGTTTYEIAQLLVNRKDVTAITYDIRVGALLYQARLKTFMAGGEIQLGTGCILGPATESFIESVRADVVFIGTSSISSDGTLFTPTMGKASLKALAIKSASRAVLVADSTKFDKISIWKICHASVFDDLVTDRQLTENAVQALGLSNVTIHHTGSV